MKKSLSLLLILALMISMFAGCSSNEPAEAAGSNEAVVSTEQTEVEVQETQEVEVDTETFELSEAPMWAEMVAAGNLPAVEDRMPLVDDIMIEPVFDSIGQYGGELMFPWRGQKDKWTLEKMTEEALFRFKLDGSGVEPNVAKGYDVNEDATEYIIYLREGMKWSDGIDFTADDVVFYFNEMVLNETFGKSPYNCYYSVDPETGEKTIAEVTKVDDYAFKVKFANPSVLFLERLAIDNKWMYAPKHYMETLLPHIVGDEEAMKKAEELGFSDLKTLGKYTGYYYWIVQDRPTLRPWLLKTDTEAPVARWERNPYYFKTDAEGKQLPYIDAIVCQKVESSDTIMLEAIAGKVSIRTFRLEDFVLMMENREAGDYRVTQWSNTAWAGRGISLNQGVEDPKLREVFTDIRFREALSVAVDRVEVAALITDDLGSGQQASVPEGLVNYKEDWDQKWTAYDVDRANALLDEMGMTKGADGFRTYSDGSNFELTLIQIESDATSEVGDFEALIKKYYEAVGIKTNVKVVDRTYGEELVQSNGVEAETYTPSLFNVALRPDNIVPIRNYRSWYGTYGLYYSSHGEQGEKPEGDMALLQDYYNMIQAATDKETVNEYSQKIIDLHEKNQWLIGYTAPDPLVVMIKNNLKNVPDKLIFCDEFRGYGHSKLQQYYFTEEN
ncbi:ABC transporter substrate-binding protein [Acidaminobacter sp. JC074]|uniref:ABC transporter substrate-binding protein n=1 Tax=Acidaminobacter sp. JC074 TaxID=2530199 RepID=UPI001F0FF749|nr:ABC transporter substrate-binding protein [Acidaminobacter sp. JC074]MCH4887003.1 ABC transporter substrate-binding protein [Acidaminobacter sp. JC074]